MKNVLDEKRIEEVYKILDMGVPILHSRVDRSNHAFMPGLHVHFLMNNDGSVARIEECHGYHNRLLVEITDKVWTVVNSLSPYLYGIFINSIDALNKFENHPLIKHAYKCQLTNGWAPDNDMVNLIDAEEISRAIKNAYDGKSTDTVDNERITFSVEIASRDFCNFYLKNKISGVTIDIRGVAHDSIFSVFGFQGLNWAR